ncbi:MAG: proton-conducting transporter membrane subunit, partial [bacterium]|nr:proton-conducting transporter membrane subunit [bacterium]
MELLLFELKNVFLPELTLLLAIIVIFLMELFFSRPLYKLSSRTALIATILPMLAISTGVAHTGYSFFAEMYVQSNFSIVLKLLILIGTFFTILLSQNIIKKLRYRAFEYYLIMLIGTFSAMCLISANNFVSMFVAMETLFVSCCMLVGFWDKYKSKEAAIKYLISSSVATAIFLFGVSILYGISGELGFTMLNL